MKVLAVESSTMTGAVALLDGDRAVAEYRLNIEMTHSERLLPAVDHLLTTARVQLADVDGFAVAIGPGSFTGLRIGVSTVKSLAFATGRPLRGVPTLDALAWTLPFAAVPLCPLLNARKGEVYAALYRTDGGRLERLSDYRALSPARLGAELAAEPSRGPVVFLGDGAVAYRDVLLRALGAQAWFAPPSHGIPSAVTVADLARVALSRGEADDPERLVPLYVRPSEAELSRSGQGR